MLQQNVAARLFTKERNLLLKVHKQNVSSARQRADSEENNDTIDIKKG